MINSRILHNLALNISRIIKLIIHKSYKTLFRCFEVNGCPGMYWSGRRACATSTVALVRICVRHIKERILLPTE